VRICPCSTVTECDEGLNRFGIPMRALSGCRRPAHWWLRQTVLCAARWLSYPVPESIQIEEVRQRHAAARIVTSPLARREWGEWALQFEADGYRFLIAHAVAATAQHSHSAAIKISRFRTSAWPAQPLSRHARTSWREVASS
jgi:hypothetical protein